MKISDIVVLKEGGFAMAAAGAQRIDKKDIPATIEQVSSVSGIPTKDMYPLGSVGKTLTSGDIDLAVNSNDYNSVAIHQKVMNALGEDNGVYNKGTKVGSYAFPIAGDPEKGIVQVDLMFVPNTEWAKFSYHSPDGESEYKGAIRTILLQSIAGTMPNEEGVDFTKFEDDDEGGNVVIRVGRHFDLASGIRRLYQYLPYNEKKAAYGKTKKRPQTAAEFKEVFPDVDISDEEINIDDPQMALNFLFNKKEGSPYAIKPADVDTAEEVLELIKKQFSGDRQKEIMTKASQFASSVAGKMKIPPEIESLLDDKFLQKIPADMRST